MEWCVVKNGIRQFDMLHAYGLGLLLATACETTVQLSESGWSYRPSCPVCTLPQVESDTLLEQVFPLPCEEALHLCDLQAEKHELPITVLDGLLTALFTTPGPRSLSVSDLIRKQHLDETAFEKGLQKVTKKLNKWKVFAGRRAAHWKGGNWLNDVLSDYHPEHPVSPILVEGTDERSIHVLMTIDPSLSYSLRSASSDGRMTEKTQVAVQGTRYAGLLAFLGASRFLRGHRLPGDRVNCYLPLVRTCSLDTHTTLSLLLQTDEKPEQAVLRQWLALAQRVFPGEAVWSGLAYQMLLTQGLQQSLSLESGELEYEWLLTLQERLGKGVLRYWQFQVSAKGAPEEQEDLETVQTRAQLFPVLHRMLLVSELEKAKEQKIIVPTENDMIVLLEDVDRYGIPVLVGLLLVLSALRYPRKDEKDVLKYETSTLIRALFALATHLRTISLTDDSARPSPDLFLDDPELSEETDEEQEDR